jgi:hypothetical protein
MKEPLRCTLQVLGHEIVESYVTEGLDSCQFHVLARFNT